MKKATRDNTAENNGASIRPLSDQVLANPPHITNLFNIPVDFCELLDQIAMGVVVLNLERKIVARVRLFKFEARDVETITARKTIEFFPA